MDKPKIIEDCTKAVIGEIDAMSREFDNLRKSGKLSRVFDNHEWIEFEVAESLSGTNYTLIPQNFCERLALIVLRIAAPCPKCRGTGYGPMSPDFIGDDPQTMKVGTVSVCLFCGGLGVDPNFRPKDTEQ